jgi:hypothetical protein
MDTGRTVFIESVSPKLELLMVKDCKTNDCDFWRAGKFIEYHDKVEVNAD